MEIENSGDQVALGAVEAFDLTTTRETIDVDVNDFPQIGRLGVGDPNQDCSVVDHGFSLAKKGEAPPAESKKESRDFITIPPAALHLERGWPVRTGIVNSLALRLRRDCMSGQGNSH